jgi:hypothetical protein
MKVAVAYFEVLSQHLLLRTQEWYENNYLRIERSQGKTLKPGRNCFEAGMPPFQTRTFNPRSVAFHIFKKLKQHLWDCYTLSTKVWNEMNRDHGNYSTFGDMDHSKIPLFRRLGWEFLPRVLQPISLHVAFCLVHHLFKTGQTITTLHAGVTYSQADRLM